MRAPSGPLAVEVGPTTAWVLGCCVVAFCIGFSATLLFELTLYDVPEVATWWDIDALVASLMAWTMLMVQSAVRLRIDQQGVHRRNLIRRRQWSWSDIDEVAVRAPRSRVVPEVLSFRLDQRWLGTPWGVNTHPGGARVLLDLVSPIAAEAGVAVTTPEVTTAAGA